VSGDRRFDGNGEGNQGENYMSAYFGDSRRPGVFVLSGTNDIQVFDQGSGIEYDAVSQVVTIHTVIYEGNESGKAELKFKPAAWLKLEEGMLVGIGRSPRRQQEASADRPYLVRGQERFDFGRARGFSPPDGDVITFRQQLKPQAQDYPGWPAEQILLLLRLGSGVIFVDSNMDQPMEIATERQKSVVTS
jgi:hypothetical protein